MAAVRVLHIVSGDLWAAAEAQVAALATALAHSPQLQLHAVVLNRGELEMRLRAAGVGVTVLDESQLSAWRIFRGIRPVVRNFRPDVIHTHREKENVLGGLAARRAGCASLRTVHGASEHRPPVWRMAKQAIRGLDRCAERHWQQASAALLADVDVLVLTSDHEGTPMAALEALSIGVPVVARAVGGLPEMLSGVAGCRLVECDEPAAFAAAVRAVLEVGEHPQLPERYNIRRCAALYRELYTGAAHSATPA